MEYDCPECNNKIIFDVSSVEVILLRLKCSTCGKILSLQGSAAEILESEDKKINIERMKELIKLAWADGILSPEEKNIIIQKSKELDIEEKTVDKIMAEIPIGLSSPSTTNRLVKEYDEDLTLYYNHDTKLYDVFKFTGKLSCVTEDDPNLKRYRQDLIRMIKHNQDSLMETAKLFEKIYNESELETQWREARSNMGTSIELKEYF